jgi:hypothetical protein
MIKSVITELATSGPALTTSPRGRGEVARRAGEGASTVSAPSSLTPTLSPQAGRGGSSLHPKAEEFSS